MTVDRQVYGDDDMLPLSGIQHYVFCPRQWALIHVEQQWDENRLTAEGHLLHENVDDPFRRMTDGSSDVITLRALRIVSRSLGLSGIADAVEIIPHDEAPKGIRQLLASRRFDIRPVEFKRGHRKVSDCDRLQAAAQAIALEEMLGVSVDRAAVFYWEERHREYFEVDEAIRRAAAEMAADMHRLYESNMTPPPPSGAGKRSCRNCSMTDLCIPGAARKEVSNYLKQLQDEETA